jgi:hypothetical protein
MELTLHFPREFVVAVLFCIAIESIATAMSRRLGYDINDYETPAQCGCAARGGDSLR